MARWTRELDGGSALQVQAYYDRVYTSVPNHATNELHTYDLDLQHSFSWGSRQEIVWGGGYRVMRDNFPTVVTPTQQVRFVPERRTEAGPIVSGGDRFRTGFHKVAVHEIHVRIFRYAVEKG